MTKVLRFCSNLSILLIIVTLTTSVYAETRINGFATLTAGSSLDEDEALRGYDEDLSYDINSIFGVQFSGDMGDGISATAQIVARGTESWEPEFTWAYVNLEMSDESAVKLGRLRIPFYTYSEFLEVGYAYQWIRPPDSVYSLPVSNVDGFSYEYNSTLGDSESSFQFVTGRINRTIDLNVAGVSSTQDVDLRNLTSIIWSLSGESLSFRIGATVCDCDIGLPTDGIADALDGLGLMALGDDYRVREDNATFTNIGLKYDAGDWFAEGEVSRLDLGDAIIGEDFGGYVSFGLFSGDYLFHLTYSIESTDPEVDLLTGIPAPLLPAATQAVFQVEQDSATVILGMRYNFHPSASLKVEYQTLEDNRENSALTQAQGIPFVDRSGSVLSASIVLVF